jgi:hypothetical protein
MINTPRPLAPELWATLPAPEPALLLEQVALLRLENAALRAENAALQARVRELEVRLSQNSPIPRVPPRRTHPRCLRSGVRRPQDANEAATPATGARSARCCRSSR